MEYKEFVNAVKAYMKYCQVVDKKASIEGLKVWIKEKLK